MGRPITSSSPQANPVRFTSSVTCRRGKPFARATKSRYSHTVMSP